MNITESATKTTALLAHLIAHDATAQPYSDHLRKADAALDAVTGRGLRILTDAELAEIDMPDHRVAEKLARRMDAFQPIPPQKYRCEPEQDGRGTIAVGAGAFILMIGFAAYGAVKFGAGVVAYYLGVPL